MAALIIALGVIFGFTGRIKDWALDDIYGQLYTIQNNDLKHIDLSLEYLKKGNALNLNIQVGAISNEDALAKMLEIERWYSQELEAPRKVPVDRKRAN